MTDDDTVAVRMPYDETHMVLFVDDDQAVWRTVSPLVWVPARKRFESVVAARITPQGLVTHYLLAMESVEIAVEDTEAAGEELERRGVEPQ